MNHEEQRAAVIAEALSWIGTPFHYEACVKGAGVACGPFLIGVYRAVGIDVPDDLPHFAPDWHMHTREERFLSIVEQFGNYVDEPQPGDAVMFRQGWTYSHGAIVIDWPQIIHAHPNARGVELADASKDPLLMKNLAVSKFISPWK